MKNRFFLVLVFVFAPLLSFASKPSADEMANYFSPARSTFDYIKLVPNPDQRAYLQTLVETKKIAADLRAQISTNGNVLTLKGDWGQLDFDLRKSDQKRIWINGVSYPVKKSYEFKDFDPNSSSVFFDVVVPEARAQQINLTSAAKATQNFFRAITSSTYNWWNNTSGAINKKYGLVSKFECKDGKMTQIGWGVGRYRYVFSYSADGNVSQVRYSSSGANRCLYSALPDGRISRMQELESGRSTNCEAGFYDKAKNERTVKSLLWRDSNFDSPLETLQSCCKSESCRNTMAQTIRANWTEHVSTFGLPIRVLPNIKSQ